MYGGFVGSHEDGREKDKLNKRFYSLLSLFLVLFFKSLSSILLTGQRISFPVDRKKKLMLQVRSRGVETEVELKK